jgi:hypothetical protein
MATIVCGSDSAHVVGCLFVIVKHLPSTARRYRTKTTPLLSNNKLCATVGHGCSTSGVGVGGVSSKLAALLV